MEWQGGNVMTEQSLLESAWKAPKAFWYLLWVLTVSVLLLVLILLTALVLGWELKVTDKIAISLKKVDSSPTAVNAQIFIAETEPKHKEVAIDNPAPPVPAAPFEYQKDLIHVNDFNNMIRYELKFPQPVDFVVAQEILGFSTWRAQMYPGDSSGKRWLVSFQVPANTGTAKAFGRFVGVRLYKSE